MFHFEPLTDKNFLLYAARHYNNPCCHSTEEFYDDLKKIKYLRKAFYRYTRTGDIKERLVLNHIIVLLNVFGPHHLPRILFFKMREYAHYLKPLLLFLNVLPDVIYALGRESVNIFTEELPMDEGIVQRLREI